MAKIDILIPSCSYEHLMLCVNSIIKHTDFVKHDAKVKIVFNGCPNEAMAWADSLPSRFTYVWINKRVGCCTAVNLAAHFTEAEYIAKMDDDNIILEWGDNWLDLLYAPFASNEVGQVGIVKQVQYGYDILIGALTMTRRSVWEKIGGLDIAFDPGGGEDTDYSIKVNKLGYKVVQATSLPSDGSLTTDFPIWHKSFGHWRSPDQDNDKLLRDRYGK